MTAPPPRVLRPTPLAEFAFAPFGTVIALPPAPAAGRRINDGSCIAYDLVDDLRLTAAGGRPRLSIFQAQARRFPLEAVELECHHLGSQAFVPLAGLRFVVLVAPPAPRPDAMRAAAFITDGRPGVYLAPGVWHHGSLAVDDGAARALERAAADVDCEVAVLAPPVVVALG